jgi:transposase-like protein
MRSLSEMSDVEVESGPRFNAVRHGLTARSLLPDVFGQDQVEQMYQRLVGELQPQTLVQEFVVRELARHYVALNRCELMEGAVIRQRAKTRMKLEVPCFVDDDTDLDPVIDALLADSAGSDALAKVSRYRRMHERAAERALETLQELQAKTLPQSQSAAISSAGPQDAPQFLTDFDCLTYLARRWQSGVCNCPSCGASAGTAITERGVWQCIGCRKQVSLRAGTLMASSRIGLRNWFQLIEAVLRDPLASTTQLAAACGLDRMATVRKLAEQVRQARESPDASQLLAGLDVEFAAGGR